jgi:endonuclease/exonuclease/phosphatase family metal-dependent hydrolase
MRDTKILQSSVLIFMLILSITFLSLKPVPSFANLQQDQKLTAMTYNIYQGTKLQDVLRSTTTSQLVKAVATDFGHVIANNFPERALAIASEVAATNPDLIGLQEVSLWQTTPISSTCPASSAITLDYLQILLSALSSKGLSYTVLVARNNFAFHSPGLFSCGLMNVGLTDRNAILVRTSDLNRGDVSISNVQSQNYVNNFSFVFFGTTFTFLGGWASVDVNAQGDTVRFISTHMDAFSQNIRTLQARELLAGPINTNLPVIFSGDMNAIDTDPSFNIFASTGFRDSWAQINPDNSGFTCCQFIQNGAIVDIINNPTSFLQQRVDHVLTRGDVHASSAILVGADPSSRTASGLWPSSHAGLVATIGVAQGNNQQ